MNSSAVAWLPLAAAACLIVSAGAHGAEPVTTVEVTGNSDVDDHATRTAKTIVVTRADIEKFGANNIGDILRRFPGVSVTTHGSNGLEIKLGGLGNGLTQILLNGDRVPPEFSLDSIAPELIDRIELVPSATAEYSTQGISGTINIILRATPRTATTEVGAKMAVENGRPGFKASLFRSDKTSSSAYTLTGVLQHERYVAEPYGYMSIEVPGQAPATSRTRKLQTQQVDTASMNATGKMTLASGATLSGELLALRRTTSEFNRDDVDFLSGDTGQFASDALANRFGLTQIRPKVAYSRLFADGGNLDTSLLFNSQRRESTGRLSAIGEDPSDELQRVVLGPSSTLQAVSNGKYSFAPGEGSSLEAGWRLERILRHNERVQDDTVTGHLVPVDLDDAFRTSVDNGAVYAQQNWDLPRKSSAYLGARAEFLTTRSSGNSIDSFSNRSAFVSPIGQLRLNLDDKQHEQVRIALARTYRAPTIDELTPRRYWSINNSVGDPDSVGNPQLRPQVSTSVDMSITASSADEDEVSASVAYRHMKDFILRRETFDGTRWLRSPANVGTAQAVSLGIETSYHLAALSPQLKGVSLKSNAALNLSQVQGMTGSDNRIAGQNRLTAGFTLERDGGASGGTIGLNYSYQQCAHYRISDTLVLVSDCARSAQVYYKRRLTDSTTLSIAAKNFFTNADKSESDYSGPDYRQVTGTIYPNYRVIELELKTKL